MGSLDERIESSDCSAENRVNSRIGLGSCNRRHACLEYADAKDRLAIVAAVELRFNDFHHHDLSPYDYYVEIGCLLCHHIAAALLNIVAHYFPALKAGRVDFSILDGKLT